MNESHVRPERRFENYSRGAELTRAIQGLWAEASGASHSSFRETFDRGVERLCSEFDLTESEWYYWSHLSQSN